MKRILSRRGLSLGFCVLLMSAFHATVSADEQEDTGSALGLRFGILAQGGAVASYEDDRPLLWGSGYAAGASLELVKGEWIPLRFEASFYDNGASTFDSSLFRYRGFYGLRLAALMGYRDLLDLGDLEVDVLAGGAISASAYTNTSLASAYYSVLLEPRLLIPLSLSFFPGLSVDLGLPLEYMFRSSARTIAAGLSLGLSIPLGGSKR